MLKVIELFSGLGSQTQALKNIGVSHEVVAVSEIDKYASISYKGLHGDTPNLGDITKIEKLPQADLWTYSFPCTDISVAGAGKGLDKGGGTRSGLLWEVERLLLQAKEDGFLPKFLLLENVKNLIGQKHKANFDMWLAFLSSLGYKNYYKVLNAKHYGIPQNRERLFCVSILGEHEPYEFPPAIPLELRLKDILEDEVDSKYYLSTTAIEKIIYNTYEIARRSIMCGDVCSCLTARDFKGPRCVAVGLLNDEKYAKMHDISRRIYHPEGLSPCVHTQQGGNTEIKIVAGQFQPTHRDYKEKNLKREEQFECRKDDVSNAVLTGDKKNCVCIMAQRGRYNESGKTEQIFEVGGSDTSNTLTTVQKDNLVYLGFHKKNQQGNRVYDSEGISATITAKGGCFGGNGGGLYKEVIVYDDYNSKVRTESDTMGTITPNCGATAVRNGYKLIDKHVQSVDAEIGRCVRVGGKGSCDKHSWDVINEGYMRIRKLTPKECLRLMGWSDEQIDCIKKAGVSNSQQYKQAGNGIVIQVLEAIFSSMFLGVTI